MTAAMTTSLTAQEELAGPSAEETVSAGETGSAATPAAAAPVAASETEDEGVRYDFIGVPEEPEPTSHEGEANLISIALDDVPLEDVVRMFTRISDANIIATATNLEGRVTVNLTDVEWQPALRSILDMHNLSLVEKTPGSGVYSIIPKAPDAPEPMLTETIFLKYTTVPDVSKVVGVMLIPGAAMSQFPSRNAIIVRSTAANLAEIQQVIEGIDKPGKQVCIETKFMELNDQATTKLGIRWDSLEEFGATLGVGPFQRTDVAETTTTKDNTRSQWDRRRRLDQVDERYDVDNVQYEESTTSFQESPPGSGNWIANTVATPTRTVTDSIDTGEEFASDVVNQFSRAIVQQQAAILTVDSLNVVLSALKRLDGVSVISNPKIIVANGDTNAHFSVGEREPIIRKEIQRGTADSPGDIVTAELDTDISTEYIRQGYLETGIDLHVIPTVKTDNLIEAKITPTLRRKIGDKRVEDNTWPIISVKEIKTRFTLKSGQTVAIGGLTDTQNSELVNKVPLLGDIPLLGKYIFSHSEDVTKQVETIIFVTLSLAESSSLVKTDGIPEDAELVHRKLIETQARKQKFQNDLQAIQEAANVETARKSRKAKARLLKRRK